jgi:adenosine deaminase CECR1
VPWLVDEALKHPGLSIASDRPLVDSASLTLASLDLLYIQHLPSLGPGKKSLLFSPNYQPGTRVSLRQAVQDFPGGEAAFKDWFLSRVTITDDETYSYHLGIDHIWGKFESVFPILNGLVFFEPIFRRMVRRMFANLLADGIRYIDLRIAFVFQWTTSSGEKGSFEDLIRVFEEEAEALQTTPAGEELWGGRIIWTIHRSQHAAGVEESMRDCMALKKKYPRVISGFDLVGQEGLGYTLLHHLPLLFWFREECARQNLDIPFFFHAGEVLGDGDEHDMNVVDAVLLDTKRIGHGYSLYKHPEIMKQVRERDICVEVCPISNETLRLNSSILGHPLPAMLAHGIPVVLANDDPGILGHGVTGSSHDFWQVLQAFDNVGLEGLGDMAETSVWFSAFHDGTGGEEPIGYGKGLAGGIRQRRVAEWRRQWEQFCSWVVAEYGRWSEWEEPDGALQQ